MIPSLPTLAIAFVILAGVLILGIVLLRKDRTRYVHTAMMTPNEIEFFHRLCKAFASYHVFPQVAMSALIQPAQGGDKGRAAFWKISQKRVDYVICTKSMRTAAIVELDDRTHDAEKDAMRDAMPRSAGIVTFRFESRNKPSVAQLRAAMQATLDQAT